MTPTDAVSLLVQRFPDLKERMDEDELWTSPHIAYSVWASEVLENSANEALFSAACSFINELADSNDNLLEELLVIDILEGIFPASDLAKKIEARVNLKSAAMLRRMETEYLERTV